MPASLGEELRVGVLLDQRETFHVLLVGGVVDGLVVAGRRTGLKEDFGDGGIVVQAAAVIERPHRPGAVEAVGGHRIGAALEQHRVMRTELGRRRR